MSHGVKKCCSLELPKVLFGCHRQEKRKDKSLYLLYGCVKGSEESQKVATGKQGKSENMHQELSSNETGKYECHNNLL